MAKKSQKKALISPSTRSSEVDLSSPLHDETKGNNSRRHAYNNSDNKEHHHHKESHKDERNDANLLLQIFELVACTAAIYVIYLTYGIYYEKITRMSYEGERFTYSMFLTTIQCFASSAWALMLIAIEASRRQHVHPKSPQPFHKRVYNLIFDQVPKHQYGLIAVSYAIAMLTSTAALNYLSYLIQALAKSSKLIPVMIGKMLRGHKYSMREYLHVAMITGGIVLFMFDPGKSSKAAETSLIGIALVVISLAMDTITGPTQDEINTKYKPTVAAMTFWINIIPALGFWVISTFVTGEWSLALDFMAKHPEIKFEIAVYCFLAAIGQSVILLALFKFNSMTLTIITTTRKFFSILASVFWFGHTLQMFQWAGVCLVFLGIGLDSQLKYQQKQSKKHVPKHADEKQDVVDTAVAAKEKVKKH